MNRENGVIVITFAGVVIVIAGLLAAITVMATPAWQDARTYIVEGAFSKKEVFSAYASGDATLVAEYTFSKHALSSKHGKWNAVTIATIFAANGCNKQSCVSKRDPSLTIEYCFVDDDPSTKRIIALVINELGTIVTGYRARANWWLNQCRQ